MKGCGGMETKSAFLIDAFSYIMVLKIASDGILMWYYNAKSSVR